MIKHHVTATGNFGGVFGGVESLGKAEITLPQSLSFDFQTGIAADTLVFGNVKWAEWSKLHVRPTRYEQVLGSEVTGFANDVINYQLGVGRKINENVSVFVRQGYEKPDGEVASRLSPTDGMLSIGLGGSWTNDRLKITGGLEYVMLGDATDGSGVHFKGNQALGIGIALDVMF